MKKQSSSCSILLPVVIPDEVPPSSSLK